MIKINLFLNNHRFVKTKQFKFKNVILYKIMCTKNRIFRIKGVFYSKKSA